MFPLSQREQTSEMFHAGGRLEGRTNGQTDITKLVIPFRNAANAHENE